MEITEFFLNFAETFDEITKDYGALGICLAMLAESAGVPFAAAFVIVTAGQMIMSGSVSFIGAVLASMLGIVVGSSISYSIGFYGQKVSRAINTGVFKNGEEETSPKQTKLNYFFERYGIFAIFMAQLWGGTRTFVSFPAGAMRMNFFSFLGYTALGGFIFTILAIVFSLLLRQFITLIVSFITFLLNLPVWILILVILGIALLGYLAYRLIRNFIYRRWGI